METKYINTVKYNEYEISELEQCETSKIDDFFDKYFKYYSLKKIGKTSNYDGWLYVAHINNEIIGAIRGDIMWGVVHIELLMVKPEFRKEGIGKKLYNRVIEFAQKNNCNMITVETFDFQAPDYWQSLGFKVDFTREGYSENTLYYLSKKI
jgi:ribosomal protein S18 acetylase RimI-like enzyme